MYNMSHGLEIFLCYYYLTADCGTSVLCVNYSQANKGDKPAKIFRLFTVLSLFL